MRALQNSWVVVVLGFAGVISASAGSSSPELSKDGADEDWKQLEVLMVPLAEINQLRQLAPEYRFWMKYSLALSSLQGAAFFERYPADPRRWQWLDYISRLDSSLPDLDSSWPQDAAAFAREVSTIEKRRAWITQANALREEAIQSLDAPPDLRSRLRCSQIYSDLLKLDQAGPMILPQWERFADEVMQAAESFPQSADGNLRALVSVVFRRADLISPDLGASARKRFAASRNAMVRTMAAGKDLIERARTEPMEMAFTSLDGRRVDLRNMRGKLVLINFWAATWCGACKEQEPLMSAVYEKYRDRGFEIIGIACENSESDRKFLENYLQQHRMPWPQYFDGRGMNNEYTLRYGFSAIPQYFLIGPDGLLIAHTHSSGGITHLEEVVRRHLKLPARRAGDDAKVLGVRINPAS